MRKFTRHVFLIIGILSLCNCEQKVSPLENENKILSDLFIDMVDSIHRDNRIYLSFPPHPETIYDKTGNVIKIDSTIYKREIGKFNAEVEKIKNDSSKLTMCISEKMYPLDSYPLTVVTEYFDRMGIRIDTTTTSNYKININKFKNNPKFKFTYSLDDTAKKDSLGNIESYSAISFSKITFDKTKTTAVLIGSYSCGPKCGIGYLIVISRNKEKWKIKEVKQIWIS